MITKKSVAVAMTSCALTSVAELCNWTGGNLNDPAHWDCKRIPGSGDAVVLDVRYGTSVVNDITDWQIATLQFRDNTSVGGSVALSGNTITIVGGGIAAGSGNDNYITATVDATVSTPLLFRAKAWQLQIFSDNHLQLGGGVAISPRSSLKLHSDVSGSCVEFAGAAVSGVSDLYIEGSHGQVTFAVAGNDIQRLFVWGNRQVFFTVPDALVGTSELWFGNEGVKGLNSTLDLGGCDQHFSVFKTEYNSTDGTRSRGTVKSASHAVLFADSTGGKPLCAKFAGCAGFMLAGDATVTIQDAQESSGTIGVSQGTVRFDEGGSWLSASNVVVSGDGRLQLEHPEVLAGSAAVHISDSGVIEIAEGVSDPVAALFIGEERKMAGTWGSVQSAARHMDWHFAGTGVLAVAFDPDVPQTVSTWDGGAQSADLDIPENWVGDVCPDLATGGLMATFAMAGSIAMAKDDAFFRGLVFSIPDDSFSIGATSGAMLFLGSGGVSIPDAEDGVRRIFSVSAPLSLMSDQSWSVAADSSLEVSGAVSGGCTLVKTGSGDVSLSDPGAFSGLVDVRAGTLSIRGRTPMRHTVKIPGVEMLDGATCDGTMTLVGANVWSANDVRCLRTEPDTRNVINGKITVTSPIALSASGTNSELVVAGGLEGEVRYLRGGEGSRIVITNTPVRLTGDLYVDGGSQLFDIAVTGNEFKNIFCYNGCRIKCSAPYALNYTGQLWLGNELSASTGDLDLGGYDQGVTLFKAELSKSGVPSHVHSARPAVLHARDDVNKFCDLSLTEYAGFAKEGPATMSWRQASCSTGTLEVANGRMIALESATWPTCTKVTVSGGVLELTHGKVFGKTTDIEISGGKVELAAGVSQRCRFLTAGGESLPSGTYGATSAAQYVRPDLFDGQGVLEVRGETGFLMIIR